MCFFFWLKIYQTSYNTYAVATAELDLVQPGVASWHGFIRIVQTENTEVLYIRTPAFLHARHGPFEAENLTKTNAFSAHKILELSNKSDVSSKLRIILSKVNAQTEFVLQ